MQRNATHQSKDEEGFGDTVDSAADLVGAWAVCDAATQELVEAHPRREQNDGRRQNHRQGHRDNADQHQNLTIGFIVVVCCCCCCCLLFVVVVVVCCLLFVVCCCGCCLLLWLFIGCCCGCCCKNTRANANANAKEEEV